GGAVTSRGPLEGEGRERSERGWGAWNQPFPTPAPAPQGGGKLVDAGDGEDAMHTFGGELGVAQDAGAVGEDEKLGQMHHRPRALETTDEAEVRLVAVEIRREDDAGLVEARGRLEDVAGERRERPGGRAGGRRNRRAGGAD